MYVVQYVTARGAIGRARRCGSNTARNNNETQRVRVEQSVA